jgi:hypothetical protein
MQYMAIICYVHSSDSTIYPPSVCCVDFSIDSATAICIDMSNQLNQTSFAATVLRMVKGCDASKCVHVSLCVYACMGSRSLLGNLENHHIIHHYRTELCLCAKHTHYYYFLSFNSINF